jgi:hypothetical protein
MHAGQCGQGKSTILVILSYIHYYIIYSLLYYAELYIFLNAGGSEGSNSGSFEHRGEEVSTGMSLSVHGILK